MNELIDTGFQVTMDETEMNIFVSALAVAGPITPTPTATPQPLDILPVTIGLVTLVVVVGSVILFKKGKA
jgi:hypothetical protein